MLRKLSVDARRAVLTAATEEARRRGDRRLGTDHLLLGVLHAEPAVEALGVTLESARAASQELDRAALVAVGVAAEHLDMAQAAGPTRRLIPLSSGARAVLKRTVELARSRTPSRIEFVRLPAGAPEQGAARSGRRAPARARRQRGRTRHRLAAASE